MTKKAGRSETESAVRQQKLPLTWTDAVEDAPVLTLPAAETPAVREPVPDNPVQETTETPAPVTTAAPPAASPPPPPAAAIHELGPVSMSLGQMLMEARAQAGLTVVQVSQTTKIPKHVIELLETDQLDRLPPVIYARSYINQLCREYGADPENYLQEFDRAAGVAAVRTDMRHLEVTSESTESGARVHYRLQAPASAVGGGPAPAMRLLVRLAVVGLAVLVLLAVVIQHYRHRRAAIVPAATENAQEAILEIDLEKFVLPQQLPLKELPIPKSRP